MGVYKLGHDYEAYRDGQRFGPWTAGGLVELDDADAEWVERDSPGALSAVKDAKPTPQGPGAAVPAGGARPRVGGDPDRAAAAAVAQRRVHAESAARQAPVEDQEDESAAEPAGDDEPATRQKRPGRDRQQRAGRNRAG